MQVVIVLSSETGKLCCIYKGQPSDPEVLTEPPQCNEWYEESNFTWSSEMYLMDVAQFLASTSSLDILCEDNNDNEDDGIEGDDVSDVFEVESNDKDNF